MTDHMSSSQPINTRSESRHVYSGPRERLYTMPRTLFVASVDNDAPTTKINGPIKIINSYLDSEFVVNKKEVQNLNNIVSSFFQDDQTDIVPYTNQEWRSLLNQGESKQHDKSKLYISLKQGLPEECRKDIWLYLAKTEHLKYEHYRKEITYGELKLQACCQEVKIKKDITRSFEGHEFFRDNKEEKLTSVEYILKAYANFDPEVGYTQGMNFLVGMLFSLIQREYSQHKGKNQRQDISTETIECEVFWVLVYIMREKNWRMIFTDNTPKLHYLLQELELRIKEMLPDLHQTLMENACVSACFTRYFLTIMLCNTPNVLAKRILEVFLLVGEEILFHVLIKVLTACEQKILAQKDIGDLYCFLGERLMQYASK